MSEIMFRLTGSEISDYLTRCIYDLSVNGIIFNRLAISLLIDRTGVMEMHSFAVPINLSHINQVSIH